MMDTSPAVDALIGMAVESWRFSRNYERLLDKMDAGERTRHISQLRWFLQKLVESLELVGMRLVDVSGQPYTPGSAVTPINLDEFDSDDELVISYMLEPVIMDQNGVVRMGKVVLQKVEKHE